MEDAVRGFVTGGGGGGEGGVRGLRGGGVGVGFGVWGLGFGVWGLGFGVWGLGFGVWGFARKGLCGELEHCSESVVEPSGTQMALGLGVAMMMMMMMLLLLLITTTTPLTTPPLPHLQRRFPRLQRASEQKKTKLTSIRKPEQSLT